MSWLEIPVGVVQLFLYKFSYSEYLSAISSYLLIILILVVRVHLLQGRAMTMLKLFSLMWGQCRGKVELDSPLFWVKYWRYLQMKTKAYKERKRKQKFTESEKETVAKKKWSIFLKKISTQQWGMGQIFNW